MCVWGSDGTLSGHDDVYWGVPTSSSRADRVIRAKFVVGVINWVRECMHVCDCDGSCVDALHERPARPFIAKGEGRLQKDHEVVKERKKRSQGKKEENEKRTMVDRLISWSGVVLWASRSLSGTVR